MRTLVVQKIRATIENGILESKMLCTAKIPGNQMKKQPRERENICNYTSVRGLASWTYREFKTNKQTKSRKEIPIKNTLGN